MSIAGKAFQSADMSDGPEDDRKGPKEFTPFGGDGDDPITRNLKKAYAEIAAEPVPDQLMDLLKQLDDADDANG